MLKGDLKQAVNLLARAKTQLKANGERPELVGEIQDFLDQIILKQSKPKAEKVALQVVGAKTFQAQVVELFAAEYQIEFGKPYSASPADFIRAAACLKPFQLESLKKLFHVAWKTPDRKDFSIANCAKTVKGFCAIVNQLSLPSTLTPAQQHEQRMKQKQSHGLESVL